MIHVTHTAHEGHNMGEQTLGILGPTRSSKQNVEALIGDLMQAYPDDGFRFVIDLTPDDDGVPYPVPRIVAYAALEESFPYTLVVKDGSKFDLKNEKTQAILDGAEATVKVVNPAAEVARRSTSLLIAWDEDDETCQKALLAAEKQGLEAYDICDGLIPLQFETEPQDDVEPESQAVDTPVDDEIVDLADAIDSLTEEEVADLESAMEPGPLPHDRHDAPEEPVEPPLAVLPPESVQLLDELADMVAERVLEAILPHVQKRGPGRPRKDGTPAQRRTAEE